MLLKTFLKINLKINVTMIQTILDLFFRPFKRSVSKTFPMESRAALWWTLGELGGEGPKVRALWLSLSPWRRA